MENFDLSSNWGPKHWAFSGKWVAAEKPKVGRFKKIVT